MQGCDSAQTKKKPAGATRTKRGQVRSCAKLAKYNRAQASAGKLTGDQRTWHRKFAPDRPGAGIADFRNGRVTLAGRRR